MTASGLHKIHNMLDNLILLYNIRGIKLYSSFNGSTKFMRPFSGVIPHVFSFWEKVIKMSLQKPDNSFLKVSVLKMNDPIWCDALLLDRTMYIVLYFMEWKSQRWHAMGFEPPCHIWFSL